MGKSTENLNLGKLLPPPPLHSAIIAAYDIKKTVPTFDKLTTVLCSLIPWGYLKDYCTTTLRVCKAFEF